jgi:hypothetical protein
MTQQLRTLAGAAKKFPFNSHRDMDFRKVASPDVVIGLLDRIDALKSNMTDLEVLVIATHSRNYELTIERDALKVAAQAGLDALEKIPTSFGNIHYTEVHGNAITQLRDALTNVDPVETPSIPQ